MTLRTYLANVKHSNWTGPSRHYFSGWARETQMQSYLSMGQVSYAKTFIHTTTNIFSKPKRRRKRYKDAIQVANQKKTEEFFIKNWKLKFKILCYKSISMIQFQLTSSLNSISITLFFIIIIFLDASLDHKNCFLKEISSFLTFLLMTN
jgi:hypothetical protein